jgi:hypothetical protein
MYKNVNLHLVKINLSLMNFKKNLFSVLFIAIFLLPPSLARAVNHFGFIENRGQILNQYKQANADVLYIYNQGNFQVQLNRNGFSYQLTTLLGKPAAGLDIKNPKEHSYPTNNPNFSSHRVDFFFTQKNENMEIVPMDLNNSHLNYYNEISEDKAILIKHFNKILYKNVYPGIDIEFLVGKDFKYNIIVHEGARLEDFKLQLLGAPFKISSDGSSFDITTSQGSIKEDIPLSYFISDDLKFKTVKAQFYNATNNSIGIKCNERKNGESLVIDPSPWSTYFGGTYYENANSVATDSMGNAYITGYTYSSSNIATTGSYQSIYGGNNDGFITKFLENGQLSWATYYGGNNNDYCYEIAITKQNNIVIAGLTGSPSGIASANAFQDSIWGTTDAFVVKLNSAGVRLWATYFGGNLFDYGYGITSDQTENIILSGYSNSQLGATTSGSYQTENGGGNDGLLAKFNPNGILIWSTFYGGYGNEYANGVTCDLAGNIYLTGFTSSPNNIASPNAFQESISGIGTSDDAFLVKFNSNGHRIWGTYFGGQGNEDGRSVFVDKYGYLYLTGSTHSSQNIASANAFQTIYKGDGDGFLAKFDTSGQKIWGTYLGDEGNDYSNDVTIDHSGKVLICGFTSSEIGLSTSNTHQSLNRGGTDAFITKFDTSGSRIWSTYFGGLVADFAYSVAIAKQDYIYFVGLSSSQSNVATNNAWQTAFGGTNDAFITCMTPNGSLIPIANNYISSSQFHCKGTLPNLILGTTPTGGSGVYTYYWLISTVGPNTNFVISPNSSNQPYYQAQSYWNNTIWIKRLVVSGGEIDSSNAISITFSTISNKEFAINSTTQCANENLFKLSYSPIASDSIQKIKWYLGDGLIDSSFNLNIVKKYNLSGNYTIKLLLTNQRGCIDSFSQNVLVKPSPTAIIFTSSPTTFCQGNQALVETNLLPGKNGKWILGNVEIGDSTSKIACRASGLLQNIQVNSYGCVDTSNGILITAIPNPIANIINVHQSNNKCLGEIVLLKSEKTNEAFYQWRFNGANIFGSNQETHNAIKSGNYTLIIRNNFGCYDTSNFETITFNDLPVANPILGEVIVKADQTTKNYSCKFNVSSNYLWLTNNANIVNANSNTLALSFSKEGIASIKMIEKNSFGCQGDTNFLNITVEKMVGLFEVNYSFKGYQIYPNPTQGIVSVDFDDIIAKKISVYDLHGIRVYEHFQTNKTQALDLSNLKPGYYFILPFSEDFMFNAKKILIK